MLWILYLLIIFFCAYKEGVRYLGKDHKFDWSMAALVVSVGFAVQFVLIATHKHHFLNDPWT